MRRHLTYANVAATLALVFAMTGGAFAAKHYLINSTRQISPRVLKKLRGAKGKTGATGAQGKQGAPGPTGTAGAQGPTGPSNVYSAFSSADTNLEFGGPVVRLAVAVPAGSYLVTAKMQVFNVTKEEQKVECTVKNDVNEAKDDSTVTVDPSAASAKTKDDGHAVPVVEVAGTLASAGHWELECSGSAKLETLTGREPELVAQQVGAISRTGS